MASSHTLSQSPGSRAAAVTPSDVTVFTNETRGVYVGVGGDLAVRMAGGGNTVVFAGVLAGSLLPIVVDQILATGTTATNIVAVH
jgi:hypothetical protein